VSIIYSQYSDDELLSLLSSHDKLAFDTIYNRYWETLYNSAFFITRDTELSKDILQDIFVWLWENRTALKIGSLRPYLRAAVKFKVANWIRSGRIHDRVLEQISNFGADNFPTTPEKEAEIAELSKIIARAIEQLPAKCREIYLLKRVEQLSTRQIADRLQVSVKTVENQISIAQKKIRASLGPAIVALLVSWLDA
jgi:RNA polymerase sigma-70 factor (family 1)